MRFLLIMLLIIKREGFVFTHNMTPIKHETSELSNIQLPLATISFFTRYSKPWRLISYQLLQGTLSPGGSHPINVYNGF